MNKSMIEKEISMGKFLFLFFGINIDKARNITHDDIKTLIPYLDPISDYNFRGNPKYKYADIRDYIRVKDKTKLVMYYYKKDLEQNLKIETIGDDEIPVIDDNDCNTMLEMYHNMEKCDIAQIECLLNTFYKVDLSNLSKLELYQLEVKLKKLKKIVGYERKVITKNVGKVQKQLRKLKRREEK